MVNTPISYAQVKFHPHSFADPDGRLFWLDGALYRGISHEKTPFFAQLFDSGIIRELMNRGLLVGSELTDLVLEGYGLVLRHTAVPFVSYPNEWCLAMFKDAALTYLDLLNELIPRGLTLKDTHPWNLLFERGKALYVDLTSITALTPQSNCPDYTKFCRYYFYPLVLISRGQERIARYLLPDYQGILESDFSLLTGRSRIPRRGRALFRKIASLMRHDHQQQAASANMRLERLRGIRRQVEAIAAPSSSEEYEEGLNAQTQHNLEQIIAQLSPVSILGLGVKTLWYSRLAERSGAGVVVFDTDSGYLTKLYVQARDKRLQLLPVFMDFTDATPSRGLPNHVSIGAADRFQCDLVLAVGLLNVIFERHLRFDQLVEGLAQFAKRWLIIDYFSPDSRPEYTFDSLTRALKKRFQSVSRLEPDAEIRSLVLCEK